MIASRLVVRTSLFVASSLSLRNGCACKLEGLARLMLAFSLLLSYLDVRSGLPPDVSDIAANEVFLLTLGDTSDCRSGVALIEGDRESETSRITACGSAVRSSRSRKYAMSGSSAARLFCISV